MPEETKQSDANAENQEQAEQLTNEQLESASAGADIRTGDTYYIGSANGGIWKTTDGGADDKLAGTDGTQVGTIDDSVK